MSHASNEDIYSKCSHATLLSIINLQYPDSPILRYRYTIEQGLLGATPLNYIITVNVYPPIFYFN